MKLRKYQFNTPALMTDFGSIMKSESEVIVSTDDRDTGMIGFFVLINFCVKMHKFARTKNVVQIERDRYSCNA